MAKPRQIVDMGNMSIDLRNVEFIEKYYSESKRLYALEITFWSKSKKTLFYNYSPDRDAAYRKLMEKFINYTNKHYAEER